MRVGRFPRSSTATATAPRTSRRGNLCGAPPTSRHSEVCVRHGVPLVPMLQFRVLTLQFRVLTLQLPCALSCCRTADAATAAHAQAHTAASHHTHCSCTRHAHVLGPQPSLPLPSWSSYRCRVPSLLSCRCHCVVPQPLPCRLPRVATTKRPPHVSVLVQPFELCGGYSLIIASSVPVVHTRQHRSRARARLLPLSV